MRLSNREQWCSCVSDGVRLILRVHFIIHNFINIHVKGIFFRLLVILDITLTVSTGYFPMARSSARSAESSVKDHICIRDFRSGWGRALTMDSSILCGSNDNFASLAAGLDDFLDSGKFCGLPPLPCPPQAIIIPSNDPKFFGSFQFLPYFQFFDMI